MKIGIIDPVGIKSGMNHYDYSLAISLQKQAVKPYIYSNFEVENSEVITKSYFGVMFSSKLSQTINFLKGMLLTCFHCKRHDINTIIVHVFSTHMMAFLTYFISKVFRLKIITIAHDVSSFTNQDNRIFHWLIYEKWSKYIIVHNEFSKQSILPLIKESLHSKLRIIKHGAFLTLPDQSISTDIAREKLNLDPKRHYILFFGRLKPTKRLDVLLNAMPAIDNSIHLIIAGSSGKVNFHQYQEAIDRLNISDRVLLDVNYITEEKRELYFKAVNAMILPYEVIFQSGVLLMSMSYGIPVVVSDIPPFKEVIVDENNGSIFQSLNPTDLAQKINTLIQDESLKKNYSVNAIQTMKKNYSWDDIAKQYIPLIS